MLCKLLMRFDRVSGDADNFSSSCRVIFPAISDRAHLTSADGRFISRVEEQHHNFASVVCQAPVVAVAIFESELRRRCAHLPALFVAHGFVHGVDQPQITADRRGVKQTVSLLKDAEASDSSEGESPQTNSLLYE